MSYINMITCPSCGAMLSYHGQPHICNWSLYGNRYVYQPVVEAVNDYIACEPFKQDVTEVVNKGTGFNTMKGFTTLTGLKVVFGNKDFQSGQTVYVRADLSKDVAAKMQYDVEGQKIVLIPIKEIRLVKRYDVSWASATPQVATNEGTK